MSTIAKIREIIMRESVLMHFGSWASNTYESSSNTKFKNTVDAIIHTYGKIADADTTQTQISVVEEGVTTKYSVGEYKIVQGLGLTELLTLGKVFTTSQKEAFNSTCVSKLIEAFEWVDDNKVLSPQGLNNAYELLKLFNITVGSVSNVEKVNYKLLDLAYIAKVEEATEDGKDKTLSLYIGEGDKLSKTTVSYTGLHVTGLDLSYFYEVTERVADKDTMALVLSNAKA